MGPSSKKQNRKKKEKISVVFDESKRREFLTGFHKRKVERRKKAQEELKQMIKEESKRIKQENKEMYKKLVVSSRPIPELEKLLEDEYEDEDVNVKIVELTSDKIGADKWIGDNKIMSVKKNEKKEVKNNKKSEAVPGMSLEENQTDVEDENEEENEELKVHTKKDIKRLLKKKATKSVQNSRAFQMKNKMERLKNKKKSMQQKSRKSKVKSGKHKRK